MTEGGKEQKSNRVVEIWNEKTSGVKEAFNTLMTSLGIKGVSEIIGGITSNTDEQIYNKKTLTDIAGKSTEHALKNDSDLQNEAPGIIKNMLRSIGGTIRNHADEIVQKGADSFGSEKKGVRDIYTKLRDRLNPGEGAWWMKIAKTATAGLLSLASPVGAWIVGGIVAHGMDKDRLKQTNQNKAQVASEVRGNVMSIISGLVQNENTATQQPTTT